MINEEDIGDYNGLFGLCKKLGFVCSLIKWGIIQRGQFGTLQYKPHNPLAESEDLKVCIYLWNLGLTEFFGYKVIYLTCKASLGFLIEIHLIPG